MRASQPLLKALRIVDGDETPAMAEMWVAMDVAKTHIKEALAHKKNLLGQVLAIVDKRDGTKGTWGCIFLEPKYIFCH